MFKENLKRFFPVCLVGFLWYFIFGPMRILTSNPTPEHAVNLIENMISWHNYGYAIMDFGLAVGASMAVFSYLDKNSSTGTIHAMPFSRKRLFAENYISGLVLALIPMLLNIVIMIIAKNSVPFAPQAEISLHFGRMIGYYVVRNFVIILFSYSVAVLANMISGNGVIRALTNVALNFVLPAFIAMLFLYADQFLKGFIYSDSVWNILSKMHPLLYMVSEGGFSVLAVVLYIAVSIAISALALVVYYKRPLEKTGDSYVFEFVKYIICFFLVFFMGTMLGLSFLFGLADTGFVSYMVGSFVGFIIAWMIVNKTYRIFNLKTLITCLVYMGIMAFILASFIFDIFGYGSRTPKVSNVTEATISTSLYNGIVVDDYYNAELSFKDAENIQHVIDLHKEVAEDDPAYDTDSYASLYVSYALKGGRTMARQYYSIPLEKLENSESIKGLLSSDELLSYSKDVVSSLDFTNAYFRSDLVGYMDNMDFENIMRSSTKREELRQALLQDIREHGKEEMLRNKAPIFYIMVEEESYYTNVNGKSVYNPWHYYRIQIFDSYEHTYNWLKENGLWDKYIQSINKGYFAVSSNADALWDKSYDVISMNTSVMPNSRDGMAIVSEETMLWDMIQALDSSGQNDEHDNIVYTIFMSYDENDHVYYEQTSYFVDLNDLLPETRSYIQQYVK